MNASPEEQQIRTTRFPDFVRSIVRGAPMAIALALIAAALAVVITRQMQPVYRSTASLLASQPTSTFDAMDLIAPPTIDASVYQRALLDGPVIREAVLRVDGVELDERQLELFKEKVRVNVEEQRLSGVIKIDVGDHDPAAAATYANAIATSLIEWDRNRAKQLVDNGIIALENSIEALDDAIARTVADQDQAAAARQQAAIATLREQRVRELEAAQARSASALVVGVLQTLSTAQPATRPSSPRLTFNTLVALLLGGALGYGIQFALWSFKDPVDSRERLARLAGVPVLAEFPRYRGRRKRISEEATAYLRTAILRKLGPKQPAVIGITSVISYAEKWGIAAALAESLNRSGKRVLLVDGDLRQRGSGLGFAFGDTNVPGLENYLKNPSLAFQALTITSDGRRGLDVVPSHSVVGRPSDLVEFGLTRFLNQVGESYDVVVIDLPPVLAYSDALAAAPACSNVVLLVDARTESSRARGAAELLREYSTSFDSAVLTGAQLATLRRTQSVDNELMQPLGAGQSTRAQATSLPNPRAMARVKNR